MPKTRNTLQRYKVLDECFNNPNREYTFENLLEKVSDELANVFGDSNGISTRQLRVDIQTMRSNGAPIYVKKNAKNNENGKLVPIYYYGDLYTGERKKYQYFASTISAETIATVKNTVELLRLYQDLPGYGWIEDISTALEIEFDGNKRQNLVSFERNPDLKGMKWLSTLIKHTTNQQPLRVTYIPFFGMKKKIIFHPYHLKQFNNRWFLWGLDEERDLISNLALDRIDNFVELNDYPFIKNSKIDFSRYFDDVIGATVPIAPIETIVLRFSERRLPYVINKPIHHTQQVHPDIPNAITLQLKSNRELEARILNYGPDVEVLAPESLRKTISEKVKSMMNLYYPQTEVESD